MTEKQLAIVQSYSETLCAAETARRVQTDERYVRRVVRENDEARALLEKALMGQFATGAMVGYGKLLKLARGAASESVQLQAAKELVDRGLGKSTERKLHDHTHTVTHRSENEVLRRMAELQRELGQFEEAEFVEVGNDPGSPPAAGRNYRASHMRENQKRLPEPEVDMEYENISLDE